MAEVAPAYPRVSLDLPPGWRPVPLDPDPVPRLARTERMVRRMFPGATPEQLAGAVEHFAAVADLQRSTGVAAAALRYSREGARFTAAYVSYALTPLDYGSAEIAAQGIYESYVDPAEAEPAGPDGPGVLRDGRYVLAVSLPCGPAVALTELTAVEAGGVGIDIGVLQVHVPVEGWQCLFVLTLMTPVLADFEQHSRDGAAMALSLRFTTPDDGGGPGWHPIGLIGAGVLR